MGYRWDAAADQVPSISAALDRAFDRGVHIDMILESAEFLECGGVRRLRKVPHLRVASRAARAA
jgi:hypothetical protein